MTANAEIKENCPFSYITVKTTTNKQTNKQPCHSMNRTWLEKLPQEQHVTYGESFICKQSQQGLNGNLSCTSRSKQQKTERSVALKPNTQARPIECTMTRVNIPLWWGMLIRVQAMHVRPGGAREISTSYFQFCCED